MKQIFLAMIALVLFVSGFPGIASAKVVWSMIAMTCTPTSTTAMQRKFVTTAGRIKFKKNAFGSISFLCPITPTIRSGKLAVEGKFTWPSATFGKGNSLVLRRANKRTGAVETILNAVIRMDHPQSKKWGTVSSPPKKIEFDFEKFFYWVQFSVSRPTSGGESPAFLGVQIVRF
jgi:hypothetical protein